MKIFLATLTVLGVAFGSSASEFCEKQPFSPEFPAGLEGRYELVGKDPSSGSAYAGTLAITAGQTGYGIGRSVAGKVTQGHAWIESCGPDKIQFLIVRYTTTPATDVTCRLGADGDNYYRATCRTDAGTKTWRGLEAWFQIPEPAP